MVKYIRYSKFDPVFEDMKKLDFVYESLKKLPSDFVWTTLFKFIDDKNFNSAKKTIYESNNNVKEISLPTLSFKEFNMGLNKSLPKYLFIKENLNDEIAKPVIVDLITTIKDSSFNSFKKEINETINNYQKIYEKARGGNGSLKELVGKTPNKELTKEDAINIGKKIANMEGYDKKKYIGMVNYLGTTCIVFDSMKASYVATKKALAEKKGKVKLFKPKRVHSGGESLKFLVNKNLKDTLVASDGVKIGKMVALMKYKDRRDFVGMMNFLGASCHIHHNIINAYMEELKNIRGDSSQKVPQKPEATSNKNATKKVPQKPEATSNKNATKKVPQKSNKIDDTIQNYNKLMSNVKDRYKNIK